MSTDHDTTRIVRSWLETDTQDSADRVLATVLARVDETPQRRSVMPVRRTRGPGTSVSVAIVGAAAVLVVSIVGYSLSARGEAGHSSGAGPLATGSAQPSPSQPITTRPDTLGGPDHGKLDPGGYDIPWPLGPSDMRVHLTVPAGWAWIGGGQTIIYRDHLRLYAFPVDLSTHAVSRIVTSVCGADDPRDAGPHFVYVGPTVDDLTAAITNVVGTHWSGPTDVTVGGYPAKRLVWTFSADECPGPARRWIWMGDAGDFFVEAGVTSSVYVIDVDGQRLVITTDDRGASAEVSAELDAVVASIDIERQVASGSTPAPAPPAPPAEPAGLFPVSVGPDADLRIGTHPAVVEGIPFSFTVPSRRWETQLGFYINKSTHGPQNAEAIIRWTTFPNGRNTDPCPGLLAFASPPSTAALADAVAHAPGVELITGPSDVTVGGRAAKHVELTVRDDAGCDPGYFYTYRAIMGGALWTETEPGDAISVWIVEVDGTLLFIEAETHDDAGPAVRQEIQQIVDSIRFE